MRFTYNQYNYYESGYRIPSKMHSNSNSVSAAYQHHHRSNFGMRMTMSTASTMTPRIHRKGFRTPSKRHPGKALPGKLHTITRIGPGKLVPGKRILPQRPHPPPCDNSNDSGFGFDQHVEVPSMHQQTLTQQQQQQQQQQQSQHGASGSSGLNATSTNAHSSTSNMGIQQHHHHQHASHHQQHQHHNGHLMQQQQQQQQPQTSQQQHSPQQQQQQHLIRAIPAARSTTGKGGVGVSGGKGAANKKLTYLQQRHKDDDIDEDFYTDDSTDQFMMPIMENINNNNNSNFNHNINNNHTFSVSPSSLSSSSASSSGSGSGSSSQPPSPQSSSSPLSGAAAAAAVAATAAALAVGKMSSLDQHLYHPHAQHGGGGGKTMKRKKLIVGTTHVDLDNDDACSEDAFIRKIAASATANHAVADISNNHINNNNNSNTNNLHIRHTVAPTKFMSGARAMTRVAHKRQPVVQANTIATSSDGRVQLEIVSQPEQQHRARYQTEGSRGAVKDRSGNGFPIVRLIGYSKTAVLQVFIGTDIGRVAPHMFYQACKVAGKNSTQCNEKKVDGTMVIEIDLKPESDMTITCDCVGILKERNVDVEHRFPDHLAQKNKKKSTRCRMVFRTQISHDDGTMETLQVCSNPIICTQPPGVPEICKKSLNSCPVEGGLEMFIIGKNFLKDTHVVFQEIYDNADIDDLSSDLAISQQMMGAVWEQTVLPDKEYLQQTHLICTVPPYRHQNILKPITVHVSIISSGKKSESHSFVYTPKGSYTTLSGATTLSTTILNGCLPNAQDAAATYMDSHSNALPPNATAVGVGVGVGVGSGSNVAGALWPSAGSTGVGVGVVETKHELDSGMMPPPISTQMPMGVRRPSLPTAATPMITEQQLVHLNAAAEALKTELLDEASQGSLADAIHPHTPETAAAAAAAAAAVAAAASVCGPHSPTTLQYHSRYARKTSLDAMMYESGSLPGFPVTPSTAAAAAAAASAQIGVAAVAAAAAAVEMAVKQQQAVSASVDKFITDLTQSTVAVADDPIAAVAEPSLFDVPHEAVIEHALTDILQQAGVGGVSGGAQPAVLERSLSISSNSSSLSSSSTAGSPLSANASGSSLNGHNSPLTQDIILNSEPAANMNVIPMQQMLQPAPTAGSGVVVPEVAAADVAVAAAAATSAVTGASLSTDIIMNPSVSPSTILRSANGAATAVVPNILAPHQVSMANSILNDIAMQPQPTQEDATVAALALSNIMMSPPTAQGGVTSASVVPTAASAVVQPAATRTAVSNLILKAAADFISNQEQQNSGVQQQQPQQLLGTATTTATTTDPLVNLLLNHHDVSAPNAAGVTQVTQAQVTQAAAAVSDVSSQFPLTIPSTTQPDSLILALATENALEKSVTAAAVTTNGAVVTQQTAVTSDDMHPAAAAVGAAVGAVAGAMAAGAVVPIPPPIPQELTTMSDQDLISYINPSTFDQI